MWRNCFILLLVGAIPLRADYPAVLVYSDAYQRRAPSISGSVIVWEDTRSGGTDIRGYDSAGLTFLDVCTANFDQVTPHVMGSYVVWADNRNGDPNQNIYGSNLSTHQETPICTAPLRQKSPRVDGSLAVWMDYRGGSGDIYAYDLAGHQEIAICTHSAIQSSPDVGPGWVVWTDQRNGNDDIYAWSRSTRLEQPICTHPAHQICPQVSDRLIVWLDTRTGENTPALYAWDLLENREILIDGTASLKESPRVSGTRVVWADYRAGNADIYGWDLSNQTTFPIATGMALQNQPDIDGTRVVWVENDLSIYYAELDLPVISIDKPAAVEMLLAQANYQVCWHHSKTIPGARVEFSADNGQNWTKLIDQVPSIGSYSWTVPNLDQAGCLLRITTTSGMCLPAQQAFTIFPCAPDLKSDLNSDCRVNLLDLALMANQWLACGNPYDPQWCNR